MPTLHSVLFHFTHQVTSGYSSSLIRDPRSASGDKYRTDFLNERQRGKFLGGSGDMLPREFFWISAPWVSESFRQDIGQFHSPRMKPFNWSAIFQKKIFFFIKNLTDLRKTSILLFAWFRSRISHRPNQIQYKLISCGSIGVDVSINIQNWIGSDGKTTADRLAVTQTLNFTWAEPNA